MTATDPAVVHVASGTTIEGSQLTAFIRSCAAATGRRFGSDRDFAEFSVQEFETFWALFLRWSGLGVGGSLEPVCTAPDDCEHARFFPDAHLSYVDNLLRGSVSTRPDDIAVIACHADRPAELLTRHALRARVEAAAVAFRMLGVETGDRVVAVARNNAEAVVAALGAAAIGATFSSAAPDMGVETVLSRFVPLEPALLLANLEVPAAPPESACVRIEALMRGLPTLRALVALDDGPAPRSSPVPFHRLSALPASDGVASVDRAFEFNHPLFVLFSSGTTGPPKCMVHGAGGTLIEHVKEHRLHCDLRRGDRLFFHTSLAWMMWNWQLSALASGATIVVYDGPVTGPDTLWRIVADARVTVFGTSPPYLNLCDDLGYVPREQCALPDLRAILSTGSILFDDQYDWVRANVGPVPLQSISGGTDIVGCFVLGNPNLPVRRGEIQCRSLGLDVRVLPPGGRPAASGQGELLCCRPFPSRPLGFVADTDGTRFHDAYFAATPGVWTHGDLVEIDGEGRVRMHGRSDGVLNVQGIRIGPAEISRALAGVHELREVMAVEQRLRDGPEPTRIVLLVVLQQPGTLDAALVARIRQEVARRASPAHVPRLVVEVPDLPRTHSGKRSELAARDAVNDAPVANAASLCNPAILPTITEAVRCAMRAAGTSDSPDTESRIRAIWEDVIDVAPIGSDENFFDVGGTSLAALRLLSALHEQLGVDLPLSTFMYAATVRSMTTLIDLDDGNELPLVVPLAAGSGRPLFIVHGLLGDVFELRSLIACNGGQWDVYGVQARGLDGRRAPHRSVEAMAEDYVRHLRAVQPRGPYAIAGYSFGGLVAYEIAQLLAAAGEAVEPLVLIDTYVHHGCLPSSARARFRIGRSLWLGAAGLRHPVTKAPRFARRVGRRFLPAGSVAPADDEMVLPPTLARLERMNTQAYEVYRPRPYRGRVVFIRAGVRDRHMCDPMPVWTRLAGGGLAVVRVPGDHFEMMTEPNVRAVADALAVAG